MRCYRLPFKHPPFYSSSFHTGIKCNSNNGDYYIDSSKRDDFLDKVKSKSGKSYLKAYISSYFENLLIRAKPWLNAPMKDGMFGKWVELAYLLPSYIPLRFGPNLELSHNRDKSVLANVQEYASSARSFFEQRGRLIGYGVGDSGLWLDSNSIYIPKRDFRLIWGLGGRSDFVFVLDDGSAEYWDLKTLHPSKNFHNIEELISLASVRQVLQQAPMQTIYSSGLRFPNVLPVKRVGVLGIGKDTDGKTTCHSKILCNPSNEAPLERLLEQDAAILERTVYTIRQAQWVMQLNNPRRVELALQVLRKAIHSLIDALIASDEWDDILGALDEYGLRKYGSAFPAPKFI